MDRADEKANEREKVIQRLQEKIAALEGSLRLSEDHIKGLYLRAKDMEAENTRLREERDQLESILANTEITNREIETYQNTILVTQTALETAIKKREILEARLEKAMRVVEAARVLSKTTIFGAEYSHFDSLEKALTALDAGEKS